MDIPPVLHSILSQKQILLGSVSTSLARFSNWLRQSRMPFFPEYTDHSLCHLEEVLRLAEYLIAASREFDQSLMTAEDSAVLVLAVLLHDLALHLTKDGFLRILSTDDPWRKIQGFDEDEPWPELWATYLREARHWRVDELHAVFGSTTPVTRKSNDSLDNLTEHDHLLIGEFLRRHHPRLAHEIAINGVPAAGPKLLTMEGFDGELSALPDLAGLVARSHGMPLRGTFVYLESKYQRIGFLRNTHVVYLMTVLRIADYLHIYSRRAPREMRLVRAERSTVSRREWDAHSAVSDINLGAPEDPESVYIEVDPDEIKNTYVFNRLSEWISGIQEELDRAWAVLGELYGNNERLRRLGLALRRVKSNLYDRRFLTQLPFHPVIASFQVTSRLIPLLIEPMYGNNPAFGIRELIQNSVDAVREARCFYAQKLHDCRKADWPTLQGLPNSLDLDVAVRICSRGLGQKNSPDEIPSNWDYWLEVADRGIGMSPAVVRDYLLRIGATFRDSETWHRLFGDDGTGVRVLRSGYFGIGILAAFLLGKEMQVTTSSLIEPEIGGVAFVSRIDVGTVDMLRISRPHGTTVRIHVTEQMAKWLHKSPSQWKWYQLPDPKVGRFLLGQSSPLEDQNPLPSPETPLPATYRSLKQSGYRDLHWTLIARAPFLSCNGIVIRETGDIETYMKLPDNLTRPYTSVTSVDLSQCNS